MGVITKNEINVQIKTSISEETLYIPSSDDDRSEVSVAVRHAQARILPRHRIPTVGPSNGSLGGPHCGKKKSRRYQNANNLETLAEENELHEVTIDDFVDNSKTAFSRLLEDDKSLQKWEAFVSSSEERQEQVITRRERATAAVSRKPVRRRFDASLRALLKKRTLPLGMVQYLESELVQFFSQMPRDVYVSQQLSSFERMLLHSLSDYHSLTSLSFDAEPKKVRLVRVKNTKDDFPDPPLLLTEYLEATYNIS